MAIGETPITLVGTVCSELAHRRVGEHELVNFWLRSTERRFDKEREAWVDGRHLLVRVTCWRRLAAGVRASLRKGDPVIVNGRLHTRKYDESGETRAVPEVEALAVGPNLMLCVAPAQRAGPAAGGEVGGDTLHTVDPALGEPARCGG